MVTTKDEAPKTSHKAIIIKSNLLSQISAIVHGFGMKGLTLDGTILTNKLVKTLQIHSDIVKRLTDDDLKGEIAADSFMTDQIEIPCFVRTADCVPILIADEGGRAVAAVHAGWRGTAKNIVGKTVKLMVKDFNLDPRGLYAAIGPAICQDCYEVGDEVIDALSPFNLSKQLIASHRVDLKGINRELLKRSGVKMERIDLIDICTKCDSRFASHRRDPENKSRQVSFIGISKSATPKKSC